MEEVEEVEVVSGSWTRLQGFGKAGIGFHCLTLGRLRKGAAWKKPH